MTGQNVPRGGAGAGEDARPIGRRALVTVAGTAVVALAGCGDIVQPIDDGRYDIHEHGRLAIVIDGERVDLNREPFVYPDSHPNPDFPPFHFHEGSDERWHMEADDRLTFAEALDSLPETSFARGTDGYVFVIEGQSYDEADGETSIQTSVDGDAVDPFEYEIHDGDKLRVEVRADGGG